jgi:hypothetical protein
MSEKHDSVAEVDHHTEILQIIPVEGWVALFGGSNGEGDPDVRPVVCWALVECAECDTRSVEPMVAIDGAIVSARDLDSYQDVAPEADVIDDLFGDEDDEDGDGDT